MPAWWPECLDPRRQAKGFRHTLLMENQVPGEETLALYCRVISIIWDSGRYSNSQARCPNLSETVCVCIEPPLT